MKPLIATPCYGGMLCLNYVTSILKLRMFLYQLGIEHEFYFRTDSLVTRARNDCVAHFMATDCTHLFFIDADIGFEPGAVLRLLNAKRDLVAGVYPIKCDEPAFPIDLAAITRIDGDGFAEANEAPTGFMCIRRGVFKTLAAAGIGRNEYFDTLRTDDEYLSEDYAFCHRWRDQGGIVSIDTKCNLTHQGTKIYDATLQEAMS